MEIRGLTYHATYLEQAIVTVGGRSRRQAIPQGRAKDKLKIILADESTLNNHNKTLPSKLQPIIYDEEGSMYLELGEKVSDAFKPGVELKDSLNI